LGLIFVFLDGVGLGPPGEENPFWRFPSPHLRRLLHGPLVQATAGQRDHLLLRPLDACLGVPGFPQSATGQTSLFTGVNAAALLGGHLSAYPSRRLQEVIVAHSLLKAATDQGFRATFANGYSDIYWEKARTGEFRHSASTLTNMAAALPFRNEADVARREALFWDVTHQVVSGWLPDVPRETPGEAAQVLHRLVSQFDLVMFESFLPDLVGHRRLDVTAEETVALFDQFLGVLVEGLSPTDTLIVTSDHGNFEDDRLKVHTRNPVPLLVAGPACECFDHLESIVDVSGAILKALLGCGAGALGGHCEA
jgi:2,3-bisphosphoglycerate-independent phosphoglycerate mutase